MAEHGQVHKRIPIKWRGEEYVLTRPKFVTESSFCKYLSDRAIEAAQRSRHILGEDGYEKAIASWQRDYAAGVYSWGSHIVDKATKHEETFKHLIYLVIQQSTPGFTKEEMEIMWKDCMIDLVQGFNALMAPDPTKPLPQQEEAETTSTMPK